MAYYCGNLLFISSPLTSTHILSIFILIIVASSGRSTGSYTQRVAEGAGQGCRLGEGP